MQGYLAASQTASQVYQVFRCYRVLQVGAAQAGWGLPLGGIFAQAPWRRTSVL